MAGRDLGHFTTLNMEFSALDEVEEEQRKRHVSGPSTEAAGFRFTSAASLQDFQATFKLDVFVKQLLYHIALPFSVLVHVRREGLVAALNQRLLLARHATCQQVAVFAAQHGAALCVWLMHAWNLALLLTQSLSPGLKTLCIAELVTLDATYVAFCGAVAVKYAFQPVTTLQRLRHARVSLEEVQQLELQSWAWPSLESLRREVNVAALAQGVHLHDSAFHFTVSAKSSAHLQAIRAQLMLHRIPGAESLLPATLGTTCRIPGRVVVESLAMQAAAASRIRKAKLKAFCLAATVTLVPFVTRAMDGTLPVLWGVDHHQRLQHTEAKPAWMFLFPIAAWIWLFSLYLTRLYLFIVVGVVDYRRRHGMLKRLNELISHSAELASIESVPSPADIEGAPGSPTDLPTLAAMPPIISLNCGTNIKSWLCCRALLKHVGDHFLKRVQACASFAMLLAIVILALLAASLLEYGFVLDNGAAAIAVVNLVILCSILGQMAYAGMHANAQSVVAREIMCNHQFWMRLTLVAPTGPTGPTTTQSTSRLLSTSLPDVMAEAAGYTTCSQAALWRADRLLDTAQHVLLLDELKQPITIMGFRADATLWKLMLSGVGSALFAAKSFFLSR